MNDRIGSALTSFAIDARAAAQKFPRKRIKTHISCG